MTLMRVTRYVFIEKIWKIVPKLFLLSLLIWSSDYNRNNFHPVRADPIWKGFPSTLWKQTGSQKLSYLLICGLKWSVSTHFKTRVVLRSDVLNKEKGTLCSSICGVYEVWNFCLKILICKKSQTYNLHFILYRSL